MIRGFLGDVLVIPTLYTLLRTFFSFSSEKIRNGVLLLAFFAEMLQSINIIELLEIKSKITQTLIGTTFDIWDMVAYLTGYFCVFIMERIFRK